MDFLFGIFVGVLLGIFFMIMWMVFAFDPERKWDEPWGASQTED